MVVFSIFLFESVDVFSYDDKSSGRAQRLPACMTGGGNL
jgi:hypothetical protein